MKFKIEIITSDNCGCCKEMLKTLQELQQEIGFEIEQIDFNDFKNELPDNVSAFGLPYLIIKADDEKLFTWCGNSKKEYFKKIMIKKINEYETTKI